MSSEVTVKVPASVRASMVDDQWAWPTGPAIAGWRRLARLGHAEESTTTCTGCRRHRPGDLVPVFKLKEGVKLETT